METYAILLSFLLFLAGFFCCLLFVSTLMTIPGMTDRPGSGDVDDFNARRSPLQLKSVPAILIDQQIYIPTVIDFRGKPEPIHCKTCIQAHSHAVFIINGLYLLKWDDAIKEAKRIRWGNGKNTTA